MEAPDFYVGNYFGGMGVSPPDFPLDKRVPEKNVNNAGENFAVDDLLDFSNEDMIISDGFFDNIHGNSTDSSTVTVVDSCNSSFSGTGDSHFSYSSANPAHAHRKLCAESQFSGELCVPYDEMAQLEWLSNFVEDSFSADHQQNNLHIWSGSKPPTPDSSSSSTRTDCAAARGFSPEAPLPGKARSKRSRAAPGDWSTRLLHLSSEKPAAPKKRESASLAESTGRKCLHCATEKTPQWRTGPMGPKTLCNACGVRYKSGRLVPEYRPAASPTFVSAKHSNSHRKVLELRRQKEFPRDSQAQQFINQSSLFGGEDFLIHRQGGPDFRHLI